MLPVRTAVLLTSRNDMSPEAISAAAAAAPGAEASVRPVPAPPLRYLCISPGSPFCAPITYCGTSSGLAAPSMSLLAVPSVSARVRTGLMVAGAASDPAGKVLPVSCHALPICEASNCATAPLAGTAAATLCTAKLAAALTMEVPAIRASSVPPAPGATIE